jgi:DNA-binding HxlR family transcriptional regulator
MAGDTRTGAMALSLLANPLNGDLLTELDGGPQELADLAPAVGGPPQSTMNLYTRALVELGALERHRHKTYPTSARYSITPSGKALLEVNGFLHRWLAEAPAGPISPLSPASKNATKALVGGWSTNLVRALSAKSLSLIELSKLVPELGYPSVSRRLSSMCRTGLLRKGPKSGRVSPYCVTEWLRRAVVPLAAAAGWERRFAPEITAPVQRADVEAAFLLAVPLMRLDSAVSGSCRLVVDVGRSSRPVGVQLAIEEDRVVSCSTKLSGEVDGYASGSPIEWLRRMAGGGTELSLNPESSIARAAVDALAELGRD